MFNDTPKPPAPTQKPNEMAAAEAGAKVRQRSLLAQNRRRQTYAGATLAETSGSPIGTPMTKQRLGE